MCDVLSVGIAGCLTEGKEGSKLAKNSVTYFMDGPKSTSKFTDHILKILRSMALLSANSYSFSTLLQLPTP